jgi:hypothetical protein
MATESRPDIDTVASLAAMAASDPAAFFPEIAEKSAHTPSPDRDQ